MTSGKDCKLKQHGTEEITLVQSAGHKIGTKCCLATNLAAWLYQEGERWEGTLEVLFLAEALHLKGTSLQQTHKQT